MICRVAHLSKNPTTEVARSSWMHCHHGGLPPRFLGVNFKGDFRQLGNFLPVWE